MVLLSIHTRQDKNARAARAHGFNITAGLPEQPMLAKILVFVLPVVPRASMLTERKAFMFPEPENA